MPEGMSTGRVTVMTDKPLSRSERQAQTYDALLDAAQTVFAQRGFHAASVAEIARAAGYTKGAVYANFTGKTGLFLAVLDRHIHEVTASPAPPQENGSSGEGPTPAAGHTPEQFRREWGLLAFEALLYAVREDPGLLRELAHRYRQVDQLNAQRLQAHDDEATAADDLAIAWSALGEGLMIRHLVEPKRISHEVIERIFSRFFSH